MHFPSTERLTAHLPNELKEATADQVHAWAQDSPGDYWEAVWEATGPVVGRTYAMKRLRNSWFIGAKLNLAAQRFPLTDPGATALWFRNELLEEPIPLEGSEVQSQVASMAAYLTSKGVDKGDRVGLYLPVIPEALYAIWATWSLGAAVVFVPFRVAGAEAGAVFRDREIRVLITADGHERGGRAVPKMPELATLIPMLDCCEQTVLVPYLDPSVRWDELPNTGLWIHTFRADATELDIREVGFNRTAWEEPLRKLELSQGGLLLTGLKHTKLDLALTAGEPLLAVHSHDGDTLLSLLGAWNAGAVPVVLDADPGYPNHHPVWKLLADSGATAADLSEEILRRAATHAVQPSDHAGGQLQRLLVRGDLDPKTWEWAAAQLSGASTAAYGWSTDRQVATHWTTGTLEADHRIDPAPERTPV